MPKTKRIAFKDAPIGAHLVTACGQHYRKDSSRTLSMAPGHSHYNKDVRRWFYASGSEIFTMVEGSHE